MNEALKTLAETYDIEQFLALVQEALDADPEIKLADFVAAEEVAANWRE
jgi:hypothetical protein